MRNINVLLFFFAAFHLLSCQNFLPKPQPLQPQASIEKSLIYGVTVDNIIPLSDIIKSLKFFKKKMTARIVFDEQQPPDYYSTAVKEISHVSFVMGQILDSSAMKSTSKENFKKRSLDYINFFKTQIDLWEIGNEVNGEWLGETQDTIEKIEFSYAIAKKLNKKTALTLYYNEGCYEKKENEMFSWAEKNIKTEIKQKIDFIFLSYYEDDCNHLQPDWLNVFRKLAVLFPNANYGFGEVGTKENNKKADMIKHYYQMKIKVQGYIGGYFWWYFVSDMAPPSKPLWSVLNESI